MNIIRISPCMLSEVGFVRQQCNEDISTSLQVLIQKPELTSGFHNQHLYYRISTKLEEILIKLYCATGREIMREKKNRY